MEESWGRRSWGDSEGIVRGRKEGEETSDREVSCALKEASSLGILAEDSGRISWSWHPCAPPLPPVYRYLVPPPHPQGRGTTC